MPIDENKLLHTNKWAFVTDVPNLPFTTSTEYYQAIDSNEYTIVVSYPASRKLVPLVGSNVQRVIIAIMALTPYWVTLVYFVIAVTYLNYFYLLLIPIIWIGTVFGHPLNPLKKIVSNLLLLSSVIFLVSCFTNFSIIFWSSLLFITSTFAIRLFYDYSVEIVRRFAEQSEQFFLYLYEKNEAILINNTTKEEFFAIDVKLKNGN